MNLIRNELSTRTDPLVSVIIIFWNAQDFLEESIQSLCQQTYRNWELLLIDDGSTDGSSKIAQSFVEKNPRRGRYLHHQAHQNRGISTSRNLGVEHSRGTFIAFLDADDVWMPAKLEEQIKILEVHPEVGMLYGQTLYWFSWERSTGNRRRDHLTRPSCKSSPVFDPPSLLPLVLESEVRLPSMSNALIRKELFDEGLSFDDSFIGLFEDQAFFAKACLATTIMVSEIC